MYAYNDTINFYNVINASSYIIRRQEAEQSCDMSRVSAGGASPGIVPTACRR